jgi:hypothetical protein
MFDRARVCLLAGVLGAAGHVTPTPLAGQVWTDEERGLLLEYLHASAGDFLASIEDLSDDQWRFQEAEDRWSIGEVAEHLALTEELISMLLTAQLPMSGPAEVSGDGRAETDLMIREGLKDRSQRFQAPEIAQPQGRWTSKAELVQAFSDARERVAEFIRTTELDLRARTAPHPVFGPIDGHQWVLLLTSHVWRHLDQIAEVKAADGYPGT